jgi:hypothetical protein
MLGAVRNMHAIVDDELRLKFAEAKTRHRQP